MLLQNILYRCKESELGVWPSSEHSETSESIVNLKILHMLCSDVASNGALCVQFRNHSDHRSFLLTVGSEGSQRSQRADRWDELHLKATCRWVLVRFRQVGAGQVPHLAFGRASGSGNLTRWVQTAPSREVLRDVSRVGSEWKCLTLNIDFAKTPIFKILHHIHIKLTIFSMFSVEPVLDISLCQPLRKVVGSGSCLQTLRNWTFHWLLIHNCWQHMTMRMMIRSTFTDGTWGSFHK